jgi:hypothetical protein
VTIISASRRTDIPAFYSEWLLKRIEEGYCLVRNPMNHSQIKTVSLRSSDVECIVFWTKNPEPMLERLPLLASYPYYFQFSLNPYGSDIEPSLADKGRLVAVFKRLSEEIGPQRVLWRYDPVLLNTQYSVAYHVENFNLLAHTLSGYTERVIFSFVDYYRKISAEYKKNNLREISDEEKSILAENFSRSAKENHLAISACAESTDFPGIGRSSCIDAALIESISGNRGSARGRDRNQRPMCGCVKSVDIGSYNTCSHGCIYCYAGSRRVSHPPGPSCSPDLRFLSQEVGDRASCTKR